jgi:hypothetical protein
LEQDCLRGTPDLVGDTIDFVRLNLTSNITTAGFNEDGSWFAESNLRGRWDIWGTGPNVVPVSEPDVLILLSSGLGGLVAIRRRGWKNSP